ARVFHGQLSLQIIDEGSARMLRKLIQGVAIRQLDITIPYEIACDGNEMVLVDGYVYDYPDLSLNFAEKWFTNFAWKFDGKKYCDTTKVHDFTLGIRPLEKLRVTLEPYYVTLHGRSSFPSFELFLELCKKHDHVSLDTVPRVISDSKIENASSEILSNAREIQMLKNSINYNSFQVFVSFDVLREFCKEKNIFYRRRRWKSGYWTFEPYSTAEYKQEISSHRNAQCYITPSVDIIISTNQSKNPPSVEEQWFTLRVESNLNLHHMVDHWAIKEYEREQAESAGQ
ncbi:hypothetical protein PENTCL1PPCAC_21578, partial [Pristionchus entomophagus]